MLDFVKHGPAGSTEKVSFLNPQKSSETKSLAFLLQPICNLPGRSGEDRLGGLGDIMET